jgi:hypothetical protein
MWSVRRGERRGGVEGSSRRRVGRIRRDPDAAQLGRGRGGDDAEPGPERYDARFPGDRYGFVRAAPDTAVGPASRSAWCQRSRRAGVGWRGRRQSRDAHRDGRWRGQRPRPGRGAPGRARPLGGARRPHRRRPRAEGTEQPALRDPPSRQRRSAGDWAGVWTTAGEDAGGDQCLEWPQRLDRSQAAHLRPHYGRRRPRRLPPTPITPRSPSGQPGPMPNQRSSIIPACCPLLRPRGWSATFARSPL